MIVLIKVQIPAKIERRMPILIVSRRALMVNLPTQSEVFIKVPLKRPSHLKKILLVDTRVVPKTPAPERRPFLILAETLLKPDRQEYLRLPIAQPAPKILQHRRPEGRKWQAAHDRASRGLFRATGCESSSLSRMG